MADDTPRTADGAEFTLGMTLVNQLGQTLPSDPALHELTYESGTDDRPGVWRIGPNGSGFGTDLRFFYSSEAAQRAGYLADLEAEKARIQWRIDTLKAGNNLT